MGQNEQEVTIRISAKNMTAAEFAAARQEISGLTDHVKQHSEKMGAETVALGELMAHAFEAGLHGLEKFAEFFPGLVEKSMKLGNQLFEMSLKTGASVEGLSKLRYVASQTGIDFESLSGTFFKMEANLGATGPKADAMQKHLSAMGLSMKTLKDEKPDQAFVDIIGGLERIPNVADRAAAGMSIFGKGFKEMGALAHEDIGQLMKDAEELGLVMDTKTAASAHLAEISMKSFSMQIEAAETKIGAAFLPALSTVTKMLGTEFNNAVKGAGISTEDMQRGVVNVVKTLLSWADTAISVGQVIYVSFNEVKAAINNVLGSVIGLFEGVFEGFGTLVGWAEKIPGIGDKFKGMHEGVRFATDALGAMKHGFFEVADESKRATDNSGQVFNALHEGLGRVSSGFATELGKTEKEIDRFAAMSKKAGGAAGEEIEGTAGKIRDQLTKLWDDAATAWAGADKRGLSQHIAVLDAKQRKDEDSARKSFKNANDLGEAMAAIQSRYDGERLAAETAAEQKVQDELDKLRDEGNKAWARADQVGLQAHLTLLDTQQAADEAAARKRLVTEGASEEQIQSILAAIDNKYDGQRYQATEKFAIDETKLLSGIRTEAARVEEGLRGHTVDVLIANNQRELDDRKAKLREEGKLTEEAEAALVELYKRKADAIVKLNDPVFLAWQGLNRDMRQEWAATWEGAFTGAKSFGDAVLQPFKDMFTGIEKMFAGFLANFQQKLLKPMFDAFSKTLDDLMNGGESGGGSGLGSNLSSMMSGKSGKALGAGLALQGGMSGVQSMASGQGFGVMNGLETGAGIGMMAGGPMGAAIGAGVGALAGWISGLGKVSQAEKDARAEMDKITTSLRSTLTIQERIEAGGVAWKEKNIAVRDAYIAVGKSEADAMAALAGLNDATHKSKDAVLAAYAEIQAVMDEKKKDDADLQTAITKYKFSIDELGPAMRKQQLTEQAVGLENEFRLLAGSGIDVKTTVEHMSGALNDYLHLSMKTGQEVPSEMKPIIDKMIEMGQLTDLNGDKVTDLKTTGITFSETMTQGFDKIIKKFDELINKISSTTGALNAIPAKKTITIDYVDPGYPTPDGSDIPGHASGGVFTRAHLARIAEGGQPEMVGSVDFMTRALVGALVKTGGMSGAPEITIHHQTVLDGKVIDDRIDKVGQTNLVSGAWRVPARAVVTRVT